LVLAGCLDVDRGQLVLGDRPVPRDELAQSLFAETREEMSTHTVTVQGWLDGCCESARDVVADRMVRAGYMRAKESRWLGRTTTRYLPIRTGSAYVRSQRLSALIRNQLDLSQAEVVLGRLSLAIAGGKRPVDLDKEDRVYLEWRVPMLPPAVRELLVVAESAMLAYRAGEVGEAGPP
jgi:hypothetical protein